MALTFDIPRNDSITISECITLINDIDDIHDCSESNIERMACVLRRLANNKSFLTELVNAELVKLPKVDEFQQGNPFPQQVISLGGGSGFWLRANIWPVADKVSPRNWERSLFAYQRAHDHNSGFLTVGYWGPGYETDIHEYDPTSVVGYKGEPVSMKFLERTTLHEGRVMYYRANRDIHTQLAPESYSVSINLLIQRPGRESVGRQFWFDTQQGLIIEPIMHPKLTATNFLCRLAGSVGSEQAVEALCSILSKHYSPFIRAAAFEALSEADPIHKHHYATIARKDCSSIVRALALST